MREHMEQRTKTALEMFRRWALLVGTFISIGGIGFIIWAADSRIKQVADSAFVTKEQYATDLAASEKLSKSEKENATERLIRIERDVREIREWIVPQQYRRNTN
jgi:hypothetical protein